MRTPDGRWHAWWQADRAPARWPAADARVAAAVQWRAVAPGLETAELEVATPGEAGIAALGRMRLVLARIDPARHALRLVAGSPPGAPWKVDDAPGDARLALNAGQFTDDGPWGWLVHGGRELQAPATGPLSSALVVARDGAVRLADAAELTAVRTGVARGEIAEAVQSYPTLLAGDGAVPAPLLADGRGLDREHRDARLAVGTLRDGRVLVVLTRLDAPGVMARVPLGLTVPEMAAVTGALGASRAMLLDGGLSAQLLVRDARGDAQRWPGLRHVPVGLVATPRVSEVAARR
ncbi:phosphodiester glycosidase family protein [Roseisolibacter agri]|uniref:phosphodiester glycosidase family protein n=1 Tax=Roseisolibacter agri TaxID=2014610 RepID=UPI0024E0A31C|nr:phosphodiester glycosidase family protein [Roseisolibacter agri]